MSAPQRASQPTKSRLRQLDVGVTGSIPGLWILAMALVGCATVPHATKRITVAMREGYALQDGFCHVEDGVAVTPGYTLKRSDDAGSTVLVCPWLIVTFVPSHCTESRVVYPDGLDYGGTRVDAEFTRVTCPPP